MKRVALAVLATLLLAGCVTTDDNPKLIVHQLEYVKVPDNLYNCPLPKKPANIDDMTDVQAADYINRLYAARQKCKASLNNIKNFSDRAAAR